MKKFDPFFGFIENCQSEDLEKKFSRIFYFGDFFWKEAGHELFHFGGFIYEYFWILNLDFRILHFVILRKFKILS